MKSKAPHLQTTDLDAVIIGGGPAGSVAGLRLAIAGWQVAVVERAMFPRRKVCGEFLSATNWEFLQQLGISPDFDAQAGPQIQRVAIFNRSPRPVTAGLPAVSTETSPPWGRALTRDCLDSLLLNKAARRGAVVMQPMRCTEIARDDHTWLCQIRKPADRDGGTTLRSPIVLAAHGSWSPATSPYRPFTPRSHRTDLLAFKAHFREASLSADLMPLLAFPGGYGGMVNCQDGLMSLSCCVRRSLLEQLRQTASTEVDSTEAGEVVLAHLRSTMPAVRDVLDGAIRQGRWLSAGPIQPGIRSRYQSGMFAIGNVAGEAHPVVAEGISMAMQSGWLAAECLLQVADGKPPTQPDAIDIVGTQYSQLWKRSFATRIRAAAVIAHWAMRPTAVRLTQPLLRCYPPLLTIAANWAGKSRVVNLQEQP